MIAIDQKEIPDFIDLLNNAVITRISTNAYFYKNNGDYLTRTVSVFRSIFHKPLKATI